MKRIKLKDRVFIIKGCGSCPLNSTFINKIECPLVRIRNYAKWHNQNHPDCPLEDDELSNDQ